MKAKYVFDTSALIAFVDDEMGSDTIADLLNLALSNKIEIFISIVTLVELRYRFLRQKGDAFANQKIDELSLMPIAVIDFAKPFVNQAALYKSTAKLSFADACIASTAKTYNAILVHKDPEYQNFADIEQLVLPLKPKNLKL